MTLVLHVGCVPPRRYILRSEVFYLSNSTEDTDVVRGDVNRGLDHGRDFDRDGGLHDYRDVADNRGLHDDWGLDNDRDPYDKWSGDDWDSDRSNRARIGRCWSDSNSQFQTPTTDLNHETQPDQPGVREEKRVDCTCQRGSIIAAPCETT